MSWQRVFVGFSLVINVILVYSLIWGGQGLNAYRNLKEQYQTLEDRVKDLDARNITLSREIRLLQADAQYQEKVIRNRFNFVKDDEILYIFPESGDAGKTGAGLNETKD